MKLLDRFRNRVKAVTDTLRFWKKQDKNKAPKKRVRLQIRYAHREDAPMLEEARIKRETLQRMRFPNRRTRLRMKARGQIFNLELFNERHS